MFKSLSTAEILALIKVVLMSMDWGYQESLIFLPLPSSAKVLDTGISIPGKFGRVTV